ncbi:MAG: hypothetical protein ACOYN0_19825 [Phycisphaerales bacterium]
MSCSRDPLTSAGDLDVCARAGLFPPRPLFGHAIHPSDANRFPRAGTFEFPRARRAGLRVSLGSDVAGGPDRSMPRAGRAILEAAAEHNTNLPGPEVW